MSCSSLRFKILTLTLVLCTKTASQSRLPQRTNNRQSSFSFLLLPAYLERCKQILCRLRTIASPSPWNAFVFLSVSCSIDLTSSKMSYRPLLCRRRLQQKNAISQTKESTRNNRHSDMEYLCNQPGKVFQASFPDGEQTSSVERRLLTP